VSRVRHHYDAIGWDSGNKEYICCCFLRKVMSEMANDHGPVVQSALLCDALARLRRDANLTRDQVANDLAWTPEDVIRIEGGHPVDEADLEALMRQYDLSAADQERLRELNRGAHEERWWTGYRHDVPARYLDYVGYERGAASIRQYPGTVVPGLLQTADYARALTGVALKDADRADQVVELRRRRRTELAARDNPPRQHYLLDEAVIPGAPGPARTRRSWPASCWTSPAQPGTAGRSPCR